VVKSATGATLSVTAENYSGGATSGYTISDGNYSLKADITKYMPDDSINTSLVGSGSISSFSFTDGSSSDVNITYDDVGKVGFDIEDRNWSAVDADDTPLSCDGNSSIPYGMYICGDINVTFVPSYFILSDVTLVNDDNLTSTYFSNDLNMSAKVDLKIVAKNDQNTTVQNFDMISWENPISIAFAVSTSHTPVVLPNGITTTKVGFSNGFKHVSYTETNASKNVMFNFTRGVGTPLNPIEVHGTDVSVGISSIYTNPDGTTTTITEPSAVTTVALGKATFIYGRTHATRQRFEDNNGTVNIYYEAYCYATDTDGVGCDKTLLPNGVSSKRTDDIRWFINYQHAASLSGDAGSD
jgi:hypothetical protein